MTLSKPPSNRTILITGAAGGMCTGINTALIEAGHRLICVDYAEEQLNAEVSRLVSLGGRAESLIMDLTDNSSIEAGVAQLIANGVQVDALINAAGILDRKNLLEGSIEAFEKVLKVNVVAPFALIKLLSPTMVSRNWGRIINISSIAGRNGYPFPSYAASKAALSNLTRALVNDFWGTPITVNSISPGLVNTPMAEPKLIAESSWRVPTGGPVEPSEIGELCAYLLTDAAKSVNGADLVIDGGITSYFQIRGRIETQ